MRISRRKFYFITALFFLLPLSTNYRLLFFGKQTTGVVVDHKKSISISLMMSSSEIVHSIIRFKANDAYIDFIGPEDLKYPIGKEIKIFYNKKNPKKFIMFNFAGLVLNNKMILPGVMLVLWFAFYLAVRDSQAKYPAKLNLRSYTKTIEENTKS